MEALQAKANLVDQRIEQLKSLVSKIGPIDPTVQIRSLEEENQRLKTRIQRLVEELTNLEKDRGVKQHYDFVNKTPVAPGAGAAAAAAGNAPSTEKKEKKGKVEKKSEGASAASAASAAPAAPAAGQTASAGDGKGKKEKKGGAEKPAKAVNTAIDITRLDLRVGKIVQVEKHPDADSLYVEQIDVGEEKPRTVCSGLVKHMQTSDLDQKLVIVLCNLKPAKMRGITSEAMVMCASTPDKVELLEPPSDCKPGDRVECDGYDCSSPDAQVKKELSDQILPGMSTNENGFATFKGTPWKISNGKGLIKSKTLVNVPIK